MALAAGAQLIRRDPIHFVACLPILPPRPNSHAHWAEEGRPEIWGVRQKDTFPPTMLLPWIFLGICMPEWGGGQIVPFLGGPILLQRSNSATTQRCLPKQVRKKFAIIFLKIMA